MKSRKKKIAAHPGYQALQEIAVQLMESTTQHDLLGLIVARAMQLLACDAGSLYLKYDKDHAVFEVAVNQSVEFEFERKTIPVSGNGIAAYVFRTAQELMIKDVYRLPKACPYHFDEAFDRKTGYRTRSVLAQPLVSSKGEVLGVLQLINRKQNPRHRWPSNRPKLLAKMPFFSRTDEKLLKSFAALAAASIEKSNLYRSIENLFKGFVHASVQVIEGRDPATRGHSERVATLSVALARKVSVSQIPEVRWIVFNEKQLEELSYAALLHDFGKVGVRESILLKEEKLTEKEWFEIRARVDHFIHAAESRLLRDHLSELARNGQAPTEFFIAQLEKKIREKRAEIESHWSRVCDLNKPSAMDAEKIAILDKLRALVLPVYDGSEHSLLEPTQADSLAIARGSLTTNERREIENHVTNTYHFLKKIPWTQEYSRVPELAYCHHEKLDGSGYPRKLSGAEVPLQSRILAICDIYDALVASDRPYKTAFPPERALQFLEGDCKAGKLDPRFLKVFIEARVYETPVTQPAETTRKRA